MQHEWMVGERLLGTVVSQCRVCGGYRTRPAIEGVDYVNEGSFHWDGVGQAKTGWTLDSDTPAECPGAPDLPTGDELRGMLERGEIG